MSKLITTKTLPAALAALGTGSNPADTGYDVVLILGQSNAAGADGAVDPVIDVPHPRVWNVPGSGTHAGTVIQGADPLGHPFEAGGVGPGMSFARWYADTIPGNRRVLLVPCARSGAGFLNSSDTRFWNPYADFAAGHPDGGLYELAIARATAALTAAGPNARLAGVLWVQGEADVNAPASTYRAYLESLIDGLRDRLAAPRLPFVIGSMLPEANGGGAVDLVHRATPARKPHTAYVPGPTGHQLADGLGVHYDAAGQREQGRRLVAGLAAARANTHPAGAVPAAPPTRPADYTPPVPAGADYPFDTAPAGWFTANTTGPLTASGGRLQMPVNGNYPTAAAPDVVDLTRFAVTWKLAAMPAAGIASADVSFGITLDPATVRDSVQVVLDNAGDPWTFARVKVAGVNADDLGPAANRPLGSYRFRATGGALVVDYSTDGTTWATLHTGPAPFPLTAVRPFLAAGRWNDAEPVGVLQVDRLTIG